MVRRMGRLSRARAGPDGRSRGSAPTGRVIRTRAGDDRLTDERGEWGIGSQEVGPREDGENYRLPGALSIPSFRFANRLRRAASRLVTGARGGKNPPGPCAGWKFPRP